MSQFQTSLGETITGVPFPFHGQLSSLLDSKFSPGQTQEIEVDDDDQSPLSPTLGLVRTRYGPYILYLPGSARLVPRGVHSQTGVHFVVSNDCSVVVGHTIERLAVLCNLNTYTNPYSAVGAGYCYCCDQVYSRAQRNPSCDHLYAQSGFNTDANDHYGPLVASTSLQALAQATCVAEGVDRSVPAKDAWLTGCLDNPSTYPRDDDVDAELQETFAENPGKIVSCQLLPLHWGGYAFHQALQVVTDNGFIATICTQSLRIVQLQHIGLRCRIVDKRTVEYDLLPARVSSATLSLDGAGGACLVLSGKIEEQDKTQMFSVADIVGDISRRQAAPTPAGKGMWTAVELPRFPCVGVQVPGAEVEPVLVPPRREVGLLAVASAQPVSDTWVLGGAELATAHTRVRRDGPPQLREALHAVGSYQLSFMRTPTAELKYHPPFRALAIERQDALQARRVFLNLVPSVLTSPTPTSKGVWADRTLQLLTRLYLCHPHNTILRRDSLDASQPLIPFHTAMRQAPLLNDRFIACTDSLGRVSVYDVVLQAAIFQRGGFVDGTVLWVDAAPLGTTLSSSELNIPHLEDATQSSTEQAPMNHDSLFRPLKHPLLLIHSGQRGVVELWAIQPQPRMLASTQLPGAMIVDTSGHLQSQHVPLDADIQAMLWRRQLDRTLPILKKQEEISRTRPSSHPLDPTDGQDTDDFHDFQEIDNQNNRSTANVIYSLLGAAIVKTDGSMHSILLIIPQE